MASASLATSSRKLSKKTKVGSFVTKDTGSVLHEGWAIKESGTALFGKTNWRKRWFRLVQRVDVVTFEYYRSHKDKIPAGFVHLDFTYCTRPIELHSKPYPNCFAVGPLLEDGARRTYYISCSNTNNVYFGLNITGDQLAMQEWIAVIDAAIQGVPEQARDRRQTVNKVFALRYRGKLKSESQTNSVEMTENDSELTSSFEAKPDQVVDEYDVSGSMVVSTALIREELTEEDLMDEIDEMMDEDDTANSDSISSRQRLNPDVGLTIEQRRLNYNNPHWRLQQWEALCTRINTAAWTRSDRKDGVLVARCKFGRSSMGHAVMKIEGVLPVEPKNVYNFLKLSTKDGGKLDYLFRNEYIVEEHQSEPCATIVYNEFQPPLPRVTKRDVIAMKIWVPPTMTADGRGGLVMVSVEHPDVPPPQNDYLRINLNLSGFVLSPHPGPNNTLHTKLTIMTQIALYGALHKMLKGAYNSGLLKLGLRTTFNLIAEQLQKYIEVTDI